MYFFSIFSILCLVVFLFVFVFKTWGGLYPILFWGAVDVPTKQENVEKMIKLLGAQPGQSVVDLGSGEGRLVIALAKKGVKAYGYEINPILVSRSTKKIKESGLEGKAFVYCKNMWSVDLKNFDGVVIYPMKHIMKRFEEKFQAELKPGAKVVSNYFTLPTWKPDMVDGKIYLYIKK